MELDREQMRVVVAICCAVARADGEVTPPEHEKLLELLGRLASGTVSFAELQRWLQEGPPDLAAHLPTSSIRSCVQEALSIAGADGKIDDAELQTIKSLAERYAE